MILHKLPTQRGKRKRDMAYTAITSLMSTMEQSQQCNRQMVQLLHQKLHSFLSILEEPWKITSHIEVLTSLESRITSLALQAQDMVDSKSRIISLAQVAKKRRGALWKHRFVLKQTVENIDSIMRKWMEIRNRYGGIGKTTLATKIYNDPYIMSRFDIRAKTFVSQECCTRNVLLRLLSSITDILSELTEGELADRLQKTLKGRRYLIVIDDIWTTTAWDDFELCFPDYHNESRILLTTRNMEVFAKECYSPEFEQLGKQIALKCRGLPLAIVVIAELLSKIDKTVYEWESVSKNVSSSVSTNLDDSCMSVLALSYHHLPHYLKSCFLYCGIFPDDELISVSKLTKLWVAKGFLKMEENKSTEEVAEKCLKDLIDISSVFIHRQSFDGRIKTCGMHDMVHELSIREARKMDFVNVIVGEDYPNPCTQSMGTLSLKVRGRIVIESPMHPYLLAKCGYNTAHSLFQFHGYNSCGIMPGLGKLAFIRTRLSWKDLSIVGKLQKLEILKLAYDACEGEEWEVVEEGFPHLKLLLLKCINLRYWRASSDQFPYLEKLFLDSCGCLNSIPQDFVDIMTLELIELANCRDTLLNLAHQIQQDIGDNMLEVRVRSNGGVNWKTF
ncbi:hypothetical protein CQW23_12577 [Capsicum baccatum]|uniref:NB-ARC domain-containing protein n=1 Tax=Capsicum baccatum TaxID=33114 RepID=A0A2G2WT65_CAPBA|nr:hypothetical protein CQW23_12577 [Capsicum baccatum]